jgi:hypothetical protein
VVFGEADEDASGILEEKRGKRAAVMGEGVGEHTTALTEDGFA